MMDVQTSAMSRKIINVSSFTVPTSPKSQIEPSCKPISMGLTELLQSLSFPFAHINQACK